MRLNLGWAQMDCRQKANLRGPNQNVSNLGDDGIREEKTGRKIAPSAENDSPDNITFYTIPLMRGSLTRNFSPLSTTEELELNIP